MSTCNADGWPEVALWGSYDEDYMDGCVDFWVPNDTVMLVERIAVFGEDVYCYCSRLADFLVCGWIKLRNIEMLQCVDQKPS